MELNLEGGVNISDPLAQPSWLGWSCRAANGEVEAHRGIPPTCRQPVRAVKLVRLPYFCYLSPSQIIPVSPSILLPR